jgi:hypothetical protein
MMSSKTFCLFILLALRLAIVRFLLWLFGFCASLTLPFLTTSIRHYIMVRTKRKAQPEEEHQQHGEEVVDSEHNETASSEEHESPSPPHKKAKTPRAKSAYQYYVSDKMHDVKEHHPDMKLPDLTREVAKQWKQCSDEEKQPYVDQSNEDKAKKEDERKKEKSDKPKRPTTAYLIFSNDNRDSIKEKNPNMKVTDIAKVLGGMWREMGDDEKQPYVDRAEQEKERYHRELKEWEHEHEHEHERAES